MLPRQASQVVFIGCSFPDIPREASLNSRTGRNISVRRTKEKGGVAALGCA
jgi:hypothetical protein